jgi:hypothetical protein
VISLLKNLVWGLLEFKIKREALCRRYALGKHANATFPCSEHKLKRTLDMIHLNVCGTMSSSYLTNTFYFVAFINDLSHRT